MSFGFFFREAIRALKRNAVPSFAAVATMLVTVLILGVFIPMVQATTGAANVVRGKVIADVYMKTNAERADIDRVQKLIETQVPHVGKVRFVSKKQALAAEREAGRGDYYDLLGSNPLPDTFRVTPDKPDNIGQVRDALAPRSPSGERAVVDPAIDEVRNREEDTAKILSVTRVVKLTMALLAVLLVTASLLLADEPTGNLDPETSIGIMQLLYRINRTGTTVVVATHDVAMVDRMRRRVIELSGGRVVRDELAGGYTGAREETTEELGVRLWGDFE